MIGPQFFEGAMLVCFGVSWPIAILKTFRTKRVEGKSRIFLILVFVGYLAGIAAKFLRAHTGGAPLEMVTGLYALNALLASSVQLDTPTLPGANGTFDRSEIESAFSWLCEQAKQSHFNLEKFHSVTIDGDQADVAFAIEALVELPGSRPVEGHYEVTFRWQLEHDTWHLTRSNWLAADR